jgi:hypothetical protein
MKLSRSFLMVTTVTIVGLATTSAFAQPLNLTPAAPAEPVAPAQPATPAQPVPPAAAEPVRPAAPAEVDPRLSFRPGDVLIERLMMGGMMPGERLEAIDTDGDGKISAAEFQAAAEALFTALDTNGDGVIDNTDRREPAVIQGGETRPAPDRAEEERRIQQFRGGMMGPNGGMMFFRGGPMFWGMPGMWFFAVPMGPGGPDFGVGPNLEFRGPGQGGGDRPNGGPNNGPDGGPNNGPNNGPNFEFRMAPGGQGGGQWFYWEGPERRRD